MENILPRREARENAFLLAFSQTFGDIPLAEAIMNHEENDEEHPVDGFSKHLLNAYFDHSAEVDDEIRAHLIHELIIFIGTIFFGQLHCLVDSNAGLVLAAEEHLGHSQTQHGQADAGQTLHGPVAQMGADLVIHLCGMVVISIQQQLAEAIHRVLFGVDARHLIAELKKFYPGTHEGEGEGHTFAYNYAGHSGLMTIPHPEKQT